MNIEERYKEIFSYLSRCECGLLVNHEVAGMLKKFINEEEKICKDLPSKYQNKLDRLKKYHQTLLEDIKHEEK